MSSSLEKLFYAGQYNEVLSLTIEDPGFTSDASGAPWIIASLAMLGRTEEVSGIFSAWNGQLSDENQIFCRFYYGLAVCRERRLNEARRIFLENMQQVRRRLRTRSSDDANPQLLARMSFFAAQGFAFFRYSTGYYRQAHFWAQKAVTASSAAGYFHGSCLAHEIYGHAQLQLGDVSAGMKNLEKALEKALKLGQGAWTQTFAASARLYRATYGLADAAKISGELLESLSKCRYEDAYTKASLQIQLARNMTLAGDTIGATAILEESGSTVYRLDNPYLETNYNLCLAYVQYLRGNYSIALSIARNADSRAKERGYIPSRLRALGLQARIMEQMGLFKERQAATHELKILTLKTGGFIPRRVLQRNDLLGTSVKRGEDPLGDLMDDVAANRKDVVNDIIASGWLFLLRQVVQAQPAQKLIVFDLENSSVSLFYEGHVLHRNEGCSVLIKKLLIALSESQEMSKEDLTRVLWGQSYNPLRHDTLIYGLIARTRKLIQPFSEWVEVTESGYRLAEGVMLKNGRPMAARSDQQTDFLDSPQSTAPAAAPSESQPLPAIFAELNLRQLEIMELAKSGEKIIPKDMAQRFEVSDATMTRDLGKLVESNLLRRCGAGRSTFYMTDMH
jgi:tetratricopeptide (TPR) repeat protein